MKKPMSLLRQLLLSLSIALLGILAGTLLFSLDGARSYLGDQLHSQSENAVTALALSLSQPANQDPVTQELLMSALFDTGQFDAVRMVAPDGETLFERQQLEDLRQERAPRWFQWLMPLPSAQAERAVSNGWKQLGFVSVTVDNQVAQEALWISSVKMIALIVAAGFAWAIFVGYLLRWFRRVLADEVAGQVMRIGMEQEERHVQSAQLQELQAVTSAIQTTHERVQHTEKLQQERIESLELETNCDPVTQLPNRKYFVNELKKRLQGGSETHGYVLLVRQRDLQGLNGMYKRQDVDDWLKGIAQQVRNVLMHKNLEHALLARINGSDFAVLLPGMPSMSAMKVVQQLRQMLQPLRLRLEADQWSRWAFALTAYADGDQISNVLVRLDQALMRAESAGHGEVEYTELAATSVVTHHAGEGQWQDVLHSALRHPQQLSLSVQSQTYTSQVDTQKWQEAALQLHEADGNVLEAALFLPAVVRLGLSAEFDLKAVQLAIRWLALNPHNTMVLRISLPSLEQSNFAEHMSTQLLEEGWRDVLPKLIFEIDAFALEATPSKAVAFCNAMVKAGAKVGLRRLDQSPMALPQLPQIQPSYVKLGAQFADQAMQNMGTRSLLEAMLETAQAQGAAIYITDLVSGNTADWLRAKGASLPVAGN